MLGGLLADFNLQGVLRAFSLPKAPKGAMKITVSVYEGRKCRLTFVASRCGEARDLDRKKCNHDDASERCHNFRDLQYYHCDFQYLRLFTFLIPFNKRQGNHP